MVALKRNTHEGLNNYLFLIKLHVINVNIYVYLQICIYVYIGTYLYIHI
jgi:hypothetical protein